MPTPPASQADQPAPQPAPQPTPQITEPLCAVFRRRLKAVGLKYTPERAQVLDTILALDAIFEAEGLQDALKAAGFRVSKATTYRTLKLLEDAGIIQRAPLPGDHASYMLAYGKRPLDLLVDVQNDKATAIDAPAELTALCERICAEHGLTLKGRRLVLYASAED